MGANFKDGEGRGPDNPISEYRRCSSHSGMKNHEPGNGSMRDFNIVVLDLRRNHRFYGQDNCRTKELAHEKADIILLISERALESFILGFCNVFNVRQS